jgi:hypothetical protein
MGRRQGSGGGREESVTGPEDTEMVRSCVLALIISGSSVVVEDRSTIYKITDLWCYA